MSSPSPAERTGPLDRLPIALALTAESAWICVYAAFLDPFASQRPATTAELLLLFIAAVVGTVAASRWHGRRLAATIVGAGIVGWLLAPGVIARLSSGDVMGALVTNPAGWLAAVAAWRGTAYASPRGAEDASTDLLERGLILQIVPWLSMTIAPDDVRSAFIATAFPATLLFMMSALLSVGFTRLRQLAREAGTDWRRNRAWMVMTAGVVAAIAAIGVPAAMLLGEPVSSIVEVLAWPVLAAFTLVALIGVMVIGVPLTLLLRALGTNIAPPAAPSVASPSAAQPTLDGPGPILAVALVALLLGIIVGIAVVIRKLSSSDVEAEDEPPSPVEERRFVMPRLRTTRPKRGARARERSPRPATDAYLAAIAAFASHDLLRRAPNETPAFHARRIAARVDRRALSLLAADYELEEYGRRTLNQNEVGRARARSKRLRDLVKSR